MHDSSDDIIFFGSFPLMEKNQKIKADAPLAENKLRYAKFAKAGPVAEGCIYLTDYQLKRLAI